MTIQIHTMVIIFFKSTIFFCECVCDPRKEFVQAGINIGKTWIVTDTHIIERHNSDCCPIANQWPTRISLAESFVCFVSPCTGPLQAALHPLYPIPLSISCDLWWTRQPSGRALTLDLLFGSTPSLQLCIVHFQTLLSPAWATAPAGAGMVWTAKWTVGCRDHKLLTNEESSTEVFPSGCLHRCHVRQ